MSNDTNRPATETEQLENGVVDTSSREDWGSKYGWFYSPDSERVYNPQNGSSGPLIITKDGEMEDQYVGRAYRKMREGEAGLWGRLGPVEIGGIEIREKTKVWHDDREEWLIADRVELIERPEVQPQITFRVKGTMPPTRLTYSASRLVELRQDGILESQQEINDQAEAALESLRNKRGES